jgi:hypothetical protein
MDFNLVVNSIKGGEYEKLLFRYAPVFSKAQHRIEKTLFRRCSEQIETYENCLGFSW